MPDETKLIINTFDCNEPGDMAAAQRWLRDKGVPFILIEGSEVGFHLIFPHIKVALACDDETLGLLIESMQEARERRRQTIADREERERGK